MNTSMTILLNMYECFLVENTEKQNCWLTGGVHFYSKLAKMAILIFTFIHNLSLIHDFNCRKYLFSLTMIMIIASFRMFCQNNI